MIQILIEINHRFSLSELAQMAIEGGCGWLVLSDGIPADEKREHYPAIVDMCREAGVMLTATADIEAVREYGLHGVFLPIGSQSPVKVRQDLGAEAVIGAEIGAAGTAAELERADIDYVALADASLIATIREGGCKIPVVAYCDGAEADAVRRLIADGYTGVCCSGLYKADDPEKAVEELLKALVG